MHTSNVVFDDLGPTDVRKYVGWSGRRFVDYRREADILIPGVCGNRVLGIGEAMQLADLARRSAFAHSVRVGCRHDG